MASSTSRKETETCLLYTITSLVIMIVSTANGQVQSAKITPDPNQDLPWWKTDIVYQVYPRSFKDSDGDGVGDIKGITSKLDYFTDLGVGCLWLSPVYKSPMVDFGYDISDFKDIDPIFGTIQDLKQLIDEAHKRGLKVITDYVPGHTSTSHHWFHKSVKREGKYTNYYVWDDGILLPNGTRSPPNNWLSVFGGSAWEWNTERQQYFYHAFATIQADLNYRDDNVQWEMRNVIRFWLDQGMDGIRIDALPFLYEVEDFSLNAPPSGRNVSKFDYGYNQNIYQENRPEVLPTVRTWYDLLEEYKRKDGQDRYMIIETYANATVRNQLYSTGGNPYNFDLVEMGTHPTGIEIRDKVLNEYNTLPSGKWPNFVLGNHDQRRNSHKYGHEYVDAYNMLLLTLWGSPTTYYGEELGMLEGDVSWEQTVDPFGLNYGPEHYQEHSRDANRTPMQWTGGYQAGFTTGNTTWLPLGRNYTTFNVKTENETAGRTSLKLYKQLAELRRKKVFQTGSFLVAVVNEDIFSYIRDDGDESYLVAINVGLQEVSSDFSAYSTGSSAKVIAITPDFSGLQEDQIVQLSKLTLYPGDGVVLQLTLNSSPIIG